MGVASSTRHPLSGALPAAPAAAAQRRAGAQAREHQARPDLRPRQGECYKSSRGNYFVPVVDVARKTSATRVHICMYVRMYGLFWRIDELVCAPKFLANHAMGHA